MKHPLAIISLSLIVGLTAACTQAIKDDTLGLSKGSVYDTPAPETFAYSEVEPDESKLLPRAFKGAPPQISHETLSMLPIRMGRKNNECLSCHDKPDMVGQPPRDGKYPMTREHYVKVDGELKLSGARYLCDQCHVPQAQVKPLVGNTF